MLTGSWSLTRFTALKGMKTIAQSNRVRRPGSGRKFKSVRQAQRLVTADAAVSNYSIGDGIQSDLNTYRDLRVAAFGEWSWVVAGDQIADCGGLNQLNCQYPSLC